MTEIEKIQKQIDELKKRNQVVEMNKDWETSYTRRILLITFTYFAIALYLYVIDVENPWINAIVPAIGFLLSTLTLPFFKEQWAKFIYKKNLEQRKVSHLE